MLDAAHRLALPAALAIVLAGFVPFAWKRLLTYLHIFQQEEYDGDRFLAWLARSWTFDRRVTLRSSRRCSPCRSSIRRRRWSSPLFMAVALVVAAVREPDPRAVGKKKLAMTERGDPHRAARLGLLARAWPSSSCALALPPVFAVVLVQAVPFALVLAVRILQPQEDRIQQRFWDEAHDKLQRLAPVVIGVTGSYGKTSTKHILGHILETAGSALITPGSVNTPMGIARIVRERLEPLSSPFRRRDGRLWPRLDRRLCRLAPPDIAVVTAVGPAHYERFKSLDVVARTKFELPEAAIERGGKAIINDEVLAFADARAVRRDASRRHGAGRGGGRQRRRCILLGRAGARTGSSWCWHMARQPSIDFVAPLYGLHHGRNMAHRLRHRPRHGRRCRDGARSPCGRRRRSPIASRSSARATARRSSTTATIPTRPASPRRSPSAALAGRGQGPAASSSRRAWSSSARRMSASTRRSAAGRRDASTSSSPSRPGASAA